MTSNTFADVIGPLAEHFFGQPTKSTKTELRFGTHGSKRIDLKNGTWFDHEVKTGGGVLDLIKQEKGFTEDSECYEWMEREGYWSNTRANGLAPSGLGLFKVNSKEVAHHDYVDEGGNSLFQVVKLEPKDFRQRRRESSGWVWSVKGVRQVPYRLPDVLEARGNGHIVFIVEGEKDADAMWDRGQPATTNAGGVKKWRDELNQFFSGADVVVIADNDSPGREHADDVASKLAHVAARVRVLDLGKHWSACQPKGDISDFFQAGKTAEDLNAIVEQLPDWVAPADAPSIVPEEITSPNEGKAFGYSWQWKFHGDADLIDSRPMLVEGLLPGAGVGLIAGQWGVYKTFVADDLAAAVMTGGVFIKFPVRRKGAVLFFACEGQSEVAIRLTAAYEARGGTGRAPFAWVDTCPRLLDPNAHKIIAAMVKHAAEHMMREFGLPVVLVIIDTAGKAASYMKSGEENDAATAKQIMKSLAGASLETGALYLGVAHFGKAIETGTRGSSSFEDDSDVVLALLGDKGINGAVTNPRLCARKRRSGPNGEEFPFRTKVVQMGVDQHVAPITTLVIEWSPEGEANPAAAKPKADQWSKSLRLLRQVLMNMLADSGSNQKPYPDGPTVRAVDLELVRSEFYKSHPATGDAKTKADTRRQALARAIREAQAKGLIGTRDIETSDKGPITYIWLAAPENAHSERG